MKISSNKRIRKTIMKRQTKISGFVMMKQIETIIKIHEIKRDGTVKKKMNRLPR